MSFFYRNGRLVDAFVPRDGWRVSDTALYVRPGRGVTWSAGGATEEAAWAEVLWWELAHPDGRTKREFA